MPSALVAGAAATAPTLDQRAAHGVPLALRRDADIGGHARRYLPTGAPIGGARTVRAYPRAGRRLGSSASPGGRRLRWPAASIRAIAASLGAIASAPCRRATYTSGRHTTMVAGEYTPVPSREIHPLIPGSTAVSDGAAAPPLLKPAKLVELPPPSPTRASKQRFPFGTGGTPRKAQAASGDGAPEGGVCEGLLTKADESEPEVVPGCCGMCGPCGHCQEQAEPRRCGWFAILARLPLLHDLAFAAWFFFLAPRICPEKTPYVLLLFMLYGITRYYFTIISAAFAVCFLSATEKLPRDHWEGLPVAPGETTSSDELVHVVLIMSYKEPLEKLAQTLDTLAANSMCGRLIVCLAMEDRDRLATQTAAALRLRYAENFYDMCYTVHRLAPGETPGRSQLHILDSSIPAAVWSVPGLAQTDRPFATPTRVLQASLPTRTGLRDVWCDT
jgi:hypothetical protein